MIKKSIWKPSNKWCEKTSKNLTQNAPQFQILAPILKRFAWDVPGVACFFRDLFFRTSWGYPVGPNLASPGAPWSDFVDLFEDFGSNFFFQKTKILEQQMAPITSSKKWTNVFTDKSSKQIMFYFCCLTKPHKSGTLGLNKNRVGGTPEGITISSSGSSFFVCFSFTLIIIEGRPRQC